MDMTTWFTRWLARHPLKAPPGHQPAQYTAEVMERVRTSIQPTPASRSILARLTWPRLGWAAALAAGVLVAAHMTLRTTSTRLATDVMRETEVLGAFTESVVEPVGSNDAANVRIVAATHRNLEEAIKESRFREDLYYRLNVFPIEMPPLRERLEDIPLLVAELITRLEHEKRGSVRLTPAAMMALCQYHWPGNVRELANFIERLVIMHPYGVVDVQDMPEKFRPAGGGANPPPVTAFEEALSDQESFAASYDKIAVPPRLPREGLDLKEHLHNLEYDLIRQALEDAGGVVAHAAERLKLRRTTLVEKLRKYGLHRGDEAP